MVTHNRYINIEDFREKKGLETRFWNKTIYFDNMLAFYGDYCTTCRTNDNI